MVGLPLRLLQQLRYVRRRLCRAAGLKNREVIVSAITTGIIGYAMGNYLGISFAYIFQMF
jgi:hypothetical protein